MLFNSPKDMFSYLENYYMKNGGPVEILTFGMYLGISRGKSGGDFKDWNNTFPMESRSFNETCSKDLKLIIGTPFYDECKPNCEDCKKKYNSILERHEATVEYLDIDTKFQEDMHMKMYRVNDLVVLGGMNLSDSDWIDCCVVANKEDGERAINLFSKLWDGAENNLERFYK